MPALKTSTLEASGSRIDSNVKWSDITKGGGGGGRGLVNVIHAVSIKKEVRGEESRQF